MMNQTSSISSMMQLDKKFIYTDEELMKRFQNGDENAYIELVNRYRDKILNFIFNYIGDFEISGVASVSNFDFDIFHVFERKKT